MALPRAPLRLVASVARTRPLGAVQQFSVGAVPLCTRLPAHVAANIRVALRNFSNSAALRQTAGPGSSADSGSSNDKQAGAEGEQQQTAEEQFSEEAYYADEPLAARISRYIWTTIKYSAGIGIVGLVFYAGYTIVVTLLPGGSSANAIMRSAGNVLRADPEIAAAYGGSLKSYGEDFGARNEGRRYFVPEYTYTDDWDGQTYTRVRFHIEGERIRKAIAWAEVRKGTYDFRYLIVMAKDKSRVWSVVDNRRPPPSVEERSSRLSSVLAEHGWTFYADGEADEHRQAEEVGEAYWLKVQHVRCDAAPSACEAAGVLSRPAWVTHKGETVKGIKQLTDLEDMTRDIAHAKKKPWYWPF